MNTRGNKDSTWSKEDNPLEEVEKSLAGRKGKKWYDYVPIDKIKDKLPIVKYVRGSKTKVSFDGYMITAQNNQAIFDKNHAMFHSRSQIDRIAWYIGSKILEKIQVSDGRIQKSKLSEILEGDERVNMFYDDLEIIKINFLKAIERQSNGYMEEKELKKIAKKYINVFSDDKQKEVVELLLAELISENEFLRTQGRLRQRKFKTKIQSKLSEVSEG